MNFSFPPRIRSFVSFFPYEVWCVSGISFFLQRKCWYIKLVVLAWSIIVCTLHCSLFMHLFISYCIFWLLDSIWTLLQQKRGITYSLIIKIFHFTNKKGVSSFLNSHGSCGSASSGRAIKIVCQYQGTSIVAGLIYSVHCTDTVLWRKSNYRNFQRISLSSYSRCDWFADVKIWWPCCWDLLPEMASL